MQLRVTSQYTNCKSRYQRVHDSKTVFDEEQLNTLNVSEQSEVYESVQCKTSSELCDIVEEE
jgi:hypothetical protein